MNTMVLLGSLGMGMAVAATALAQDANPSAYPQAEYAAPAPTTASEAPGRFFLGARLGYGLPMGDAQKGQKMSDGISGQIPIWLDVGYMVTPNILVGLYGQYGIASVADKACPSGADCSASAIRFGVQGQYHIMPTEGINPWVGLGVGYEMASLTVRSSGPERTGGYKGMEYINLQGGADFRVAPVFAVGPFVSFSLGKYGSTRTKMSGGVTLEGVALPDTDQTQDIPSGQTAMHEWLLFGIRGAFKL